MIFLWIAPKRKILYPLTEHQNMLTLYHYHVLLILVLAKCVLSKNCRKMYLQMIVTSSRADDIFTCLIFVSVLYMTYCTKRLYVCHGFHVITLLAVVAAFTTISLESSEMSSSNCMYMRERYHMHTDDGGLVSCLPLVDRPVAQL